MGSYDSILITVLRNLRANLRAIWVFIGDKDRQGNPYNLVSCTLAESSGIIFSMALNANQCKATILMATPVKANLLTVTLTP